MAGGLRALRGPCSNRGRRDGLCIDLLARALGGRAGRNMNRLRTRDGSLDGHHREVNGNGVARDHHALGDLRGGRHDLSGSHSCRAPIYFGQHCRKQVSCITYVVLATMSPGIYTEINGRLAANIPYIPLDLSDGSIRNYAVCFQCCRCKEKWPFVSVIEVAIMLLTISRAAYSNFRPG